MFSSEFEENRILQWALGALLFGYFIAFFNFVRVSVVTTDAVRDFTYTCLPYFQSCGDWYFLRALPDGYSQTLLYMVFFGVMLWCVYLFSKRRWKQIQLNLLPIFAWHTVLVWVLTDRHSGNFEYYLVVFGVILLFLPHKEFFLKLCLVIFYVASTVAKLHPSWIEGGYFTALRTGLPLFPDWSIPVWTNLVIFMEMVGSWFLMAKNMRLQRLVLIFFVAFHLYSGILVEYRYPATVLPVLLIVFGPWYRYTPVPLDKKSIGGWILIIIILAMQFAPQIIPGDEKVTLEGNKYGLYMFEANHQCISQATVRFKDDISQDVIETNASARYRCDPYVQWFRFHQMCKRTDAIQSIQWKFDHSINGGPFYRIVDVVDACSLSYAAFGHNDWIKNPEEAVVVGYPVENYYR